MINGPPERKAPRAKEDRNERLEESSTCKMGMQVSCSHFAEVPEESDVWKASAKDRRDIAKFVPTERHRNGGGQWNA